MCSANSVRADAWVNFTKYFELAWEGEYVIIHLIFIQMYAVVVVLIKLALQLVTSLASY